MKLQSQLKSLMINHWMFVLIPILSRTVSVESYYVSPCRRSKGYPQSSSSMPMTASVNGQGGAEEDRTLYDILNASPTDTTQQLRQNYRALVRQTHPDAVLEEEKEQAAIQFSEIAEAWSILSNPKERLRYDRSIKAREITDSIEEVLEGGFRAAFSTAYQTSRGIQNVGEQLDKARESTSQRFEEVRESTSQRFERARKTTELQKKSKSLLQKSQREAAKYDQLQSRLANRDRRHELLQQRNNNGRQQQQQQEGFTSSMANKVFKSFQQYDRLFNNSDEQSTVLKFQNNGNTNSDEAVARTIEKLVETEQESKQTTKAHKETLNSLIEAERRIEQSKTEEQRALENLQEAQRRLEEAQAFRMETEKAHGTVLQTERVAFSNVERSQNSLQKQQDRTIETLRRFEDLCIWRENAYLKEESRKAKDLSTKLKAKADELQGKAEALRNEENDSI